MRTAMVGLALALVIVPGRRVRAQGAHDHPAMHPAEDSAFKAMKSRGTGAMGVDQDKSSHRFTDLPDGGRIELASDATDSTDVAAIRIHFAEIQRAFSTGDFTIPGVVHDRPVPGTDVMRSRATWISYRVSATPRGAALRITTKDRSALAAIHRFLAFQREDHHAGQ